MKFSTTFFNQGTKKVFSIFFLFFLYTFEASAQETPSLSEVDLLPYHLILGKELFDLGLFDKAVEEYKRVLEIDPNHSSATKDLANSYLKLNKHEQAIQNWKKLLTLIKDKKEKAGINLNIGIASFEKKDKESSLFYTFKALQLSTQHRIFELQEFAKSNLENFKKFYNLTDAEVIDIVKHFKAT
jgi:tetratricopeptide (TPR) repeat protein